MLTNKNTSSCLLRIILALITALKYFTIINTMNKLKEYGTIKA